MKIHVKNIRLPAKCQQPISNWFFNMPLTTAISLLLYGCGGGEDTPPDSVYSIIGKGSVSTSLQTSANIYSSAATASSNGQNLGPSGNNTITVSATGRTAGAVSSIRWNGKEFINDYDHGRQMQFAWQYGYNECANPTEAGSSSDGTGVKSSSILRSVSTDANTLHTISTPASWLACGPSIANDQLEKRITIEDGVIKISAIISAKSIARPIRIEAPTIYLAPEFDYFYTIDGTADHSTCIAADYNVPYWQNMQGCDISFPIIAATEDGAFAIGLYTVPTGEPITYAFYHLTQHNAGAPSPAQTRKISVYVQSNNDLPDHEITSYVAIGDLATVRAAIAKLSK